MDEKIYDCIVIGGGISGVSFAYYLKKAGKNVLLIDDKQKPGGRIQTEYSSENQNYWFEMGAHTCYNTYANLLSIIRETGLKEFVRPLLKHGYTVYSHEKIKGIFSEISIVPMIPACFKYFKSDRAGKTVKDFFRPLVGVRNYDRLFGHAFSAVICQPADDYPASIFLKKRNGRDKTFPRKFTFKQGLSSLIDSILNKREIEHIQSAEIKSINKDGELFVCKAGDGRLFKAENISLAVNPSIASRLLIKLEADVSKLLSSVSSYSSESLNVIVPKEKLKITETAGIISLSNDFLSAVSRDLISDEKLRSFTFHFEKGVKPELSEKINLICKALKINISDIKEQKPTEHILSARRLQNVDIEKDIDKILKNKRVYITGNFFQGLSMEDCVTRSKHEAERFLENNR